MISAGGSLGQNLIEARQTDQARIGGMKQHTSMPQYILVCRKESLETPPFCALLEKLLTPHERWMDPDIRKVSKGNRFQYQGRLYGFGPHLRCIDSKRVYKSQIPHEKAVEIIAEEKGPILIQR